MQLFSRIVIGVFARPRRRKIDQKAYETMQARLGAQMGGAEAQSQGESLHVRFEDLFEGGMGPTHRIGEERNWARFSRARRYSRQTSCGASWT